MPKFLCNERQERVEQSKGVAHDKIHHRQHVGFASFIVTEEGRLAGLNIPVAVFAPKEAIERCRGIGESLRLERRRDLIDRLAKPQ